MSAVDFSMYVAHANNWDVDQREKHAREVEARLLDEILAEFHQLMNEKREAIEGIEPYSFKMPDYGNLTGRTHHLVSKDEVLSILKD